MKTKFLIQIPLFLQLVTLIACQSEEPNPNSFPEIGETSGNYIACRINGSEFVSFSTYGMFNPQYPNTHFQSDGRRGVGTARYFADTMTWATIEIKLDNTPSEGSILKLGKREESSIENNFGNILKFYSDIPIYRLIDSLVPDNIHQGLITNGNHAFYTNVENTGEFVFTKVDTVNQIYQGTFWADVKFQKYSMAGLIPSNIEPIYWDLVANVAKRDTARVLRIRDGRFYYNASKNDLIIKRDGE
jgi:hypothetical protein